MKKLSAVLVSLSIFFVTGAVLVYAQENIITNPSPTTVTTNPSGNIIKLENPFRGGDSLFALLRMIIDNIILPIGGVLAVLAFIYSGFLYVTAQGNETKLATAHRALLYTAIGTAVLLGSWVIAKVIENTINQLR
ncbi:MAG: hypothetical protein WD897_00740 [Parcubacteria group bacterium]